MNSFSWLNSKCHAKRSSKYGMGVFAIDNIKKKEIIAVFGGNIIPLRELKNLPKEIQDSGLQISEFFSLGYRKKSEIEDVSYLNHCCDPNAGIKGQIFLVAIKDINIGEEITFDYATTLSKAMGVGYYKFKCLCGSKKCRGQITEDDWKIPELQKKYAGYFQYFIQEKINKLKNKK